MRTRWQFGIIAGIFLAIFCLYPQLKMVYLRGDAWNGHYAYNDIDEVAYGSYLRALIDGRPRKNDPYTGRDHSPDTPQPESLFSIQFAAPYSIALPARLFGISAPWAMTIAGAFAGFFAALAVFWLLSMMIGDAWFAMAGALAVFCFGTLAAGEGAVSEVFFGGFSYPYFPGFRRYIPAMSFPAFFAMCALLWRLLNGSGDDDEGSEENSAKPISFRRSLIISTLAVACFAYTVYSYFYVWTTAAAFLACLGVLWLVERPNGFKHAIRSLCIIGAACAAVLVPYAYLLSQRSETMDHVQLLVHTRAPDLFRFPEYVSFAVLLMLIAGMALKRFEMKQRSTLFALGLAIVPFILFNQQIITGRSLQPIHYQVFIGNYVAALAFVVTAGLFWKKKLGGGRVLPRLWCIVIAVCAVFWGFVECHYTVRVLDGANIARDTYLPMARHLEELAESEANPHSMTVLAFDGIFADDLPTVAPQNVLWSRHQHVFAGLSWQESKERYYQYLHYSNVGPEGLERLLKRDFVSQIALFGWGRHSDRLSSEATPITYAEVDEEVKRYAEYIADFDRTDAANPLLSYVVIPEGRDPNLTNLQAWYDFGESRTIGGQTLYRVMLRAEQKK